MTPYRSADARNEPHPKPWPLSLLVAAAFVAWWLVEHAIGSIAGRFQ